MATLNESESGKAVKGRTKKPAPRVDLTAMVDLMFLLTTFFMLTTTLGQLNAADVAKPDKTGEVTEPYPESRTMTLLLGKNNKAVSYMGTTEGSQMKVIDMNAVQSEISLNKLRVNETHHNNPAKYLIVIIKPSKTSKFKNFVDAVDEMKIGDVKSFAIDDDHISPREEEFMKANGI